MLARSIRQHANHTRPSVTSMAPPEIVSVNAVSQQLKTPTSVMASSQDLISSTLPLACAKRVPTRMQIALRLTFGTISGAAAALN